MNDRDVALACVGLAVAALLVGVLAFPAALADPITTTAPHQYHSVHESSQGYEDTIDAIEERDASAADLREIAYDDLSPEARRAFDRTRSDADGPSEGVWDPTVCQPHFVGCPYVADSELPPELANGYLDDPVESAVFVDTDDGRYLFWTPPAMAETTSTTRARWRYRWTVCTGSSSGLPTTSSSSPSSHTVRTAQRSSPPRCRRHLVVDDRCFAGHDQVQRLHCGSLRAKVRSR